MGYKKIFIVFWLCLFIIGLTAGNAFSDAAPDPLNKGLQPVRKISRVRLVSEQVDVILGPDRCDFEVRMVFRNAGSVAESMEVGFPTSYDNEVRNPQVWIDGHKMATRNNLEKRVFDETFEGKLERKTYLTHWILWDMNFEPQRVKNLRMVYWVKPRKNIDYIVTPYTGYRNRIAESFRNLGGEIPVSIKTLLDSMTSFSTGYILHTGSGWNNVIDRAVINVYHPAKGSGALRWFHPQKNFTMTDRKATWLFRNLEPDFDIAIEFNHRLSLDQELNGVRAALAEYPSNDALKNLKAYLEELKSAVTPNR